MIGSGKLAAAAALIALAAAGAAWSQTAPGAISVGADDGEYTGEGFALRGRAEVVQGQNRLRADRINGFTRAGELDRVEAAGSVYFVTPEQTIRGDRAVYTLSNNTVVVTGDVVLTQGQNVVTGARLTYNVRTEEARIEGSGQGGRIRGVFYPNSGG